jgi:hypothetical protein
MTCSMTVSSAVAWLAVLCLGTLRTPFAPICSMIATLWLLGIWAGELPRAAGGMR